MNSRLQIKSIKARFGLKAIALKAEGEPGECHIVQNPSEGWRIVHNSLPNSFLFDVEEVVQCADLVWTNHNRQGVL